MKSIGIPVKITVIFFTLSLFIFSCSTPKKAALSCPELPAYRGKTASPKFRSYNRITASVSRSQRVKRESGRSNSSKTGNLISASEKPKVNRTDSDFPGKIGNLSKTDYINSLSASTGSLILPHIIRNENAHIEINAEESKPADLKISEQNQACDTIWLKNGSIVLGKVDEIGISEIKYRKCNFLTGPSVSVLKTSVSLITYSNGSHDSFTADEAIPAQRYMPQNFNPQPQKTEGLGLAGFILSLTGLFVGGIPLGILAVIFGAISLSKIKNGRGKYKGRGFAIASLVIGLVDILGVIIILATVV